MQRCTGVALALGDGGGRDCLGGAGLGLTLSHSVSLSDVGVATTNEINDLCPS